MSESKSDIREQMPRLISNWITPDWPAPANIHAYVTTRGAALNAGPYGAFNTADHVGDDPAHVQACRTLLQKHFDFQHPPLWLDQVHGVHVVDADPATPRQAADAVSTQSIGQPLTIHTADCLPLFFCNRAGTQIALAHAGWRGLASGVIENTVKKFSNPEDLYVWLGPAIGPNHFEVGNDVRDAFLSHDPQHTSAFLLSTITPDGNHWMCDIYTLARQRLTAAGVTQISGGNFCTVNEEHFFSYRRDKITGRMLSLLWME